MLPVSGGPSFGNEADGIRGPVNGICKQQGREERPLVSIVLPTYNGAKYIRESLHSIQKQTYANWELIIVDDGSEDDTLEIAQAYQKNDSRVQVIHNEKNVKLPGALNIGFEYAGGKYFTWTSDDNVYLPDALSVMVERMEGSLSPMVCADMRIIDGNGEEEKNFVWEYKDEMLCRYNSVGACFLYRGDIADSVGPYDPELFYAEDYDYWLRIKKRYGRIERIGRVLYQYRYHDGSLTISKKEQARRALIKLRKKHLTFILDDFKDRKDLLIAFYYEMLERQTMDEEIRGRIQSVLPELKNDVVGTRKRYIVFGAGDYGQKAFQIAGEMVAFYADNNRDKVGKYKNGKEILSFEKMISLANQYDIMVAIHFDNTYQLICQLLSNNVCRYCTLQTYLSDAVCCQDN